MHHLGLGPDVKEVAVEVIWPSGKKTNRKTAPGPLLVVEEVEAQAAASGH